MKEEVPTDTETMPTDQVTQENITDELGLIQVPALPNTSVELRTQCKMYWCHYQWRPPQNLWMQQWPKNMKTLVEECKTTIGQAVTQCELPKTIPCSINLTDISANLVDGVLVVPLSQVPLEPKVIVETEQYDLRKRASQSRDSMRPKRKASSNINYGLMDVTSEEEELIISDSEQMNIPAKNAPSGYQLATHKYMLAKCQGLIQGPTIRTKALKIINTEPVSSVDSEATEDYVEPSQPIRKRKKLKPKSKPKKTGTLVTRSYFVRKDGEGTSLTAKPKRKHKFKCPKCQTSVPV